MAKITTAMTLAVVLAFITGCELPPEKSSKEINESLEKTREKTREAVETGKEKTRELMDSIKEKFSD
ncbi:YtxH domain-containing protein [bacterium]|nr:MAG: YtxH domain-containing protein [bacterium]